MHRLARIAITLLFPLSLTLMTVMAAAPASAAGTTYQAGTAQNYLVLYRASAVPADAAASLARAGGTLVASYGAIGVVVARSDNAAFAANMAQDSRVEGAAGTAGFATPLRDESAATAADVPPGNAPVTDNDNLSGLQWDMKQISADKAHAITGGSPAVLVGDIDSGLDYTHPDLAPNVDFANSVSCVGGAPNQDPAAWDDDAGHGTHTAGTIAAAANGIGIVGVAPRVRIAGIKASDAGGYFYPEAVVCSFMWAGSHHMDVTNNSYFADPWLFNCRNDAGQRAIWKAEQRAIRYAMGQGVTVVAAAGNDNYDLAHPTIDIISPDDGTPITREVTNACLVIPVEIPGVIGVSADGNLRQKSYYSTYGVNAVQVVAPGGDRLFQVTAAAPNGRVLSTYPAKFFNPASPLMLQDCTVSPCAVYAYLQGTSMASPHVAGVAALVISRYGKMNPSRVQAIINQTANSLPCPPNPFNPGGTGVWLANCQGGPGYNSFYGHGEVDALKAISR